MNKLIAGLLLALASLPAAAATLIVSQPNLTVSTTGNVEHIVCAGSGCALTGTPFTLSGGTGASITAQAVVDANHANVTISAGSNSTNTGGVLTLADTISGATVPIQVWALEHQTVFSGQSTTSVGAAGSTTGAGDGGAWTDVQGGVWFTAGGSPLAVVPSVGGSGCATVPLVNIAAPNGTGPRKITAAATAVISGGSVVSTTMTNLGRDYVSIAAPTSSGGSCTGVTYAVPTLSGHMLESVQGNAPFGGDGLQGYLLRPFSVSSINQRSVQYSLVTSTTDGGACDVRVNPTTAQLYAISWFISDSTGDGFMRVWYGNNYQGSTGSQTLLANLPITGALIGHIVSCDASATGFAPSTVTAVVTDITTGTVLTQGTFSDNSPGVQTTGQAGTGYNSARMAVTELDTFIQQSVLATPTAVGLNISNQCFALTGQGTNWLTSTPVFTISGGTASKVSQSISTDTTAQLCVSTGNVAANMIITDPSLGETGVVALTAMQVPAATASLLTITSQGATVAGGAATFANSPCTYYLYRSPFSNQVPPSDPNATLIAMQTSVTNCVAPANVVDTTATAEPAFYKWYYCDASAQCVYGAQVPVVIPATTNRYLLVIGDSTAKGTLEPDYQQWLVNAVVGSGGTSCSNTIGTITGGTGSGAVLHYNIVGGVVQYAFVWPQGLGWTGAIPTITPVCAGTPEVVTLDVGGGEGMALQTAFNAMYPGNNLVLINAAVGGSASVAWRPHGGGGNNSYYLEAALAKASYASSGTPFTVIYRIGANDSNQPLAPSAFQVNVADTMQYVLAHGGSKMILAPPFYRAACSSATEQAILNLQLYAGVEQNIVTANPGQAFLGSTGGFPAFIAAPWLLNTDCLHPNSGGGGMAAVMDANIIGRVMGLQPVTTAAPIFH